MTSPRCLAATLAFALGGVAWSAPLLVAAPTSAPATQAAAPAADPDDPDGLNKVVPDLNLNDASLDDAVAFLQDVSPNLKVVVIRDAGVPAGYPSLTMRVKNVSAGQLLELFSLSSPGIELKPIEGQRSELRVLHVHVKAIENGGGGGMFGGGGAGVRDAGGVRVYRLTAAVDAIAARPRPNGKPTAPVEAMADVLSLLKAALAQTAGGGIKAAAPVLQVHEETQTLIFKGTPEQRAVVEDVLTALTGPEGQAADARVPELKQRLSDVESRRETDQLRAAILAKDAEEQRRSTQDRVADLSAKLLDREAEVERLKIRLEAAGTAKSKSDSRDAPKN